MTRTRTDEFVSPSLTLCRISEYMIGVLYAGIPYDI